MVIAKLAASIKKMHREEKMLHRNINLDTVVLRTSKSEPCGYTITRISGTEYAARLKPGESHVAMFEGAPSMAPEVEAGHPHGEAVEIWSLG